MPDDDAGDRTESAELREAHRRIRLLEQDGVRTVGSDAQLDNVSGTLSRGGAPFDVPGYKGTWIERSDGVRIGLRDASKSGGRAIDIRYPDGTTRKIHIE